jgi:hypothetical protein
MKFKLNTAQKPSHTPGPWTVGSQHYIYAGEGMDRAGFAQVFSGSEADADANLIAAAPDLLAALQEQLRWAEHHANDMTIAEHNRQWFSSEVVKLRAVIAKATGAA